MTTTRQQLMELKDNVSDLYDYLEAVEFKVTKLESLDVSKIERKIYMRFGDRLDSLEGTLLQIQEDLKATQQIVKLLAQQNNDQQH